MNRFFVIASKKKKGGHVNTPLKNDVGWHIQRWGQFYYLLHWGFKNAAVIQRTEDSPFQTYIPLAQSHKKIFTNDLLSIFIPFFAVLSQFSKK